MATIETDVAVIGAGPCGAAAAWRLASRGVRVALIDQGGWPGADAGQDSANPNIRRRPEDYPIDDTDCPTEPMIGNAVGGGSLYWSAHAPRFRPGDFRVFSEDGVAEDWPLTYADLDPWYALNEARVGVAWAPGDPSAGPRSGTPRPLPDIGPQGRLMSSAFEALGWHWWPVDLVVGREPGEPCQHTGPCHPGCPAHRRARADRAYVVPAQREGARVLAGHRVLCLEHGANHRVIAAVCATGAGTVRVTADRFVLAANGIGTPRLLLLSASGAFPDGLANGSGLVGRNLMLHPHARVSGWFPDCVAGWEPGQTAGIICMEFYGTDRSRGFLRGAKLQVSLNGGEAPWPGGPRFNHVIGVTVCADDLPEPDNRVSLSEAATDPTAKLSYRLSDNARAILDHGMDRAEQALAAAGATRFNREPLRRQAGFHLMGTARMGTDPDRSVTDKFGRCHQVENLYIADASLFVTGSAVNPTATAQALALRGADHLLSRTT